MLKLRVLAASAAALIAIAACTSESQPTVVNPNSNATIVAAVVSTLQAESDVESVVATAIAEGLASLPTAVPLPTAIPTATSIPPTPAPTPTPSPPPEPTPVPSPTATATATSTPEPTPTPLPTATPFSLEALIGTVGDSVVRIATEYSSGSGVMVKTDEDGKAYILTNNHVIDLADFIQVTVQESDKYTAELLNTDPIRDLAVITICCDPAWSAIPIADSAEIGNSVVALGYPLGFTSLRVSSGVISGKQVDSFRKRIEAQTDAAINPGNSGGPLILNDGSIAGLNTFVVRGSSSRVNVEGIGFAIAAETLAEIVPRMLLDRFSFTPPPFEQHPSIQDGIYWNDKWNYELAIPPGWRPNIFDEDSVVFAPFRNDVLVSVSTIPTTSEEALGSVFGYLQNYTLKPAPWWDDFNIFSQAAIERDIDHHISHMSSQLPGWEFRYRYEIGGKAFTGITHWFLVWSWDGVAILDFSVNMPEKIWLNSEYDDERFVMLSILNSLVFRVLPS